MDLFIEILNLSLVSSYVIILVIIARLLLKKSPTIYSYILWSIVFIRLTCSFTFELPIGLIQESQPIKSDIIYQTTPQTNTQIDIIDNTINSNPTHITQPKSSVNPVIIAKYIWFLGVFLMLSYNLYSYIKLKKKLIGSMLFMENNIYISDYITSPFVIDIIKPKIYLPTNIKSEEIDFILMHEKTHIKRFDHITRVIALIILSLHWFNPLVWVAYMLSGKDMELSCDEFVMKQTITDIRKEYSQSLLNFATVTTPAFGINIAIDTKERIQNIMNFKKPIILISLISVLSVTILLIGCMTSTAQDTNIFIGVGEVKDNNIDLILKPFSTTSSSSTEDVNSNTKFINNINQDNLFATLFGEIPLIKQGDDYISPDIYISPNHMAIFTLDNSKGLQFTQDYDMEFSFNLGNNESLTLETGFICDGIYYPLNKSKGVNFIDNFNASPNREYYFCVTNLTSENAIIQNGIIKTQIEEEISIEQVETIVSEIEAAPIPNNYDLSIHLPVEPDVFRQIGDDISITISDLSVLKADNTRLDLGSSHSGNLYYSNEYNLLAFHLMTDKNLSDADYELIGSLAGEEIIIEYDLTKNEIIKNQSTDYFNDIINNSSLITDVIVSIYQYALENIK